MILHALTPGTTMKFPLSVKMSTVNQQKAECSIDVGPLALTLVSGKQTSAVRVDWVPYAPGGINYLESDHDVLSGIFTGCVMATYSAAKQRRVAHVHTGDDAGAGLDCKDLMKGLLGGTYAPIYSFKPFDRNSDVDIYTRITQKTTFGAQGCAPFGLVTAANTYHVIFTRKVSNSEYVVEEVRDRSGAPYAF